MACPIIFPRKTNISTWAGDVAPGLGTYRSRPTPAAWTPFGVRMSRGSAVDYAREGQGRNASAVESYKSSWISAGHQGRAEQPGEDEKGSAEGEKRSTITFQGWEKKKKRVSTACPERGASTRQQAGMAGTYL